MALCVIAQRGQFLAQRSQALLIGHGIVAAVEPLAEGGQALLGGDGLLGGGLGIGQYL